MSTIKWHARPLDASFAELEAHTDGLSEADAAERLVRVGPNRLTPARRRGPLERLLAQFNNLLILILLGAAVVTALLAHWADCIVIIGVVVINAVIGFIQEGKAERALESILAMLSPQATVLRDGERMVIDAEDLVPGDVVLLSSGDKVPADMRLFRTHNLQIQEAPLTGESLAVDKATHPVADDAALGDRSCMAYAGTLVAVGQGAGVVVATADRTEIGRVSALLSQVEQLETPLQRQIAAFSRLLTTGILTIAALTFLFGTLVRDYAWADMFSAVVGLAVAAIPEGLPAIMTITLAIGVQRMAKRSAIIRRLPAIETLGALTVICTDKTGTLTRNEMTAQTIVTSHHMFTISGVGYLPAGDFHLNGETVSIDDHPLLSDMAHGAVLCSDAVVHEIEGEWGCDGDPTEGALVVAAMKAGLTPHQVHERFPRSDVIPFESEQQFMATLHHETDGSGTIYVKGAPERIVALCALQHGTDGDEAINAAFWMDQVHAVSAKGQRVIALARRHVGDEHRSLAMGELSEGLVLLGLFGLADPPREDAAVAVEQARSAGIDVKMITGDHAGTARAIGEQIGLAHESDVLTGTDLDELDDDELVDRVLDVDIYARTSPAQKLRLVQALQRHGDVVAMTGDGVNDAPALKRADVGVAMGQKGTEASKEASEMVLADDNFASITHAVEEGRTVYDNLIKAIVFILPTNGGQALSIMAAVAMGGVLPITAPQILWVNMITAVTLALALAFEPTESGVMVRPPRLPDQPILSRFLMWRVAFVSVVLVIGVFGLFHWELSEGAPLESARSVAVHTLVMFEVFYLFNTRYLTASALRWDIVTGSRAAVIGVVAVIAFQVAFIYFPPLQALFGTGDIGLQSWGRIIAVGATIFVLVEVEKAVLRRLMVGQS